MSIRTATRKAIRIAATTLTIDRWSNYDHKAPMKGDITNRTNAQIHGWAPASWIGDDHMRRIQSYIVTEAYRKNISREFLQGSDEERANRREYGDADLIVKSVHNALLGDEVTIQVPGAERYDPELDQSPDTTSPDGADTEDKVTPERRAENAAAKGLMLMQDRLTEWADEVHLELRIVDCESNAVGLGDGVYLMGWDAEGGRPVPAVMSPETYFPVLPDSIDSYDFPTRVHFAWAIPADPNDPDSEEKVRRITYEVKNLEPVIDELKELLGEDKWVLPPDTVWRDLGDGVRDLTRLYPWNEKPTRKVCLMSDGIWTLDGLKDASSVDTFPEETAEWALDEDGMLMHEVDLGIDFLPVVHVPNTPPGGEHFGESSIANVVQILDDLSSADTDLSLSSATTGSPIIVVKNITGGMGPALNDQTGLLSGRRPEERSIKPGAVWTGDGADVIDTSGQLAALQHEIDGLRDRLSVNAQIPGTVLGTVKPSEVSSGFHMQLTFGPLKGMIRMMRLVRSVKYPLLLKMAQRFYQLNDPENWPAGPNVHATVSFGAFMPTDQTEVMGLVQKGVDGGVISLETGLQMLQAVGFPIDDVAEEVARIQSRDYEGANALADATGDQNVVREFLGLKPLPEGEQIPDPTVEPPAGGTGTGQPSRTDSGGTA